MVGNTLDLLTGTVTIPEPAPPSLRERGMGAFYTDPNHADWGPQLCRVLYHESLHFWQFLASGYMGNLVASEWTRVVAYRETGQVEPRRPIAEDHRRRQGDDPFSALELVECLARFWDVHTRGAHVVVGEEDIPVDGIVTTGEGGYTHVPFDAVMLGGVALDTYSGPYRWMLDRTGGHSAFVVLTFPTLAFHALGSPRPVEFFRKAFDLAWGSDHIHAIMSARDGSVNLDWFLLWQPLYEHVVMEVIREGGFPTFTSGLDVIDRGPLGSHPVYREYLAHMDLLVGKLRMLPAMARARVDPAENPLMWMELEQAAREPLIVFGLPGQPDYRELLGAHMQPPEIRFADGEVHWGRPSFIVQEGEDPTFATASAEVARMVGRFRAAEKAVALGLPANAFEG